jgi:hypothetical protein
MNMNDHDGSASFGEIGAARLLLAKMGISPADLLRASAAAPGVPVFADYIPRVFEAVSDPRSAVPGWPRDTFTGVSACQRGWDW